eukprot:scaffold290987_cov17-Prasinocladus_malaysianus.AAC.1
MVFVGHLDMMTLFDRATRRAALPVTMDSSPFSPKPRLYSAVPLQLGASGEDEVLEVILMHKLADSCISVLGLGLVHNR